MQSSLSSNLRQKISQYLVEPSKCIRRGRKAAKLPLHKAIIPILYAISDLDAKIVITIVQRGSVSQRLPEKKQMDVCANLLLFPGTKKKNVSRSLTVNKHF